MHIADTLSRAYTEGPHSAASNSDNPDTDYDLLTIGPAVTPQKLN